MFTLFFSSFVFIFLQIDLWWLYLYYELANYFMTGNLNPQLFILL